VTFHYKSDAKTTPQFGLIAEDVAKVNPDPVTRDAKGEIYTVRYEAVNAMLLNEFLKARRQIDAQQKQIDALTAGLQKVTAQLEVSRSPPQTLVSNS
jgi:trimeric autotransporter adhesin